MNFVLNDSLCRFKLLADNQQYQDRERVVLSGAGPARGEDSVSWSKRNNVSEGGSTQHGQNNDVRTALLDALKGQFDGTIPASVKRALVGTGRFGASDMDTDSDGRVNTGRPLTMRRIRQVLDAVATAMQNKRASLSVDLADGQLTIEEARALVKDQLRLMIERWPAGNGVLSEGHLASLREQIDTTDLKTLARLYEGFANNNPDPAPADRVERTPAHRDRLDAMLSTEEGREETANAAQGVPPESRESFVKFLGRPDVRRQLVEHLSQLTDAPLYWEKDGQWNNDFAVSQLVSLWQNEQLAVANEQQVLTDRLASGLVHKDMTVATQEAVNGAMQVLAQALEGQAVLGTVTASFDEMQAALDACRAARETLAGVRAEDIASNSNGARNILAEAVEAGAALAEKIMSVVNAVREQLGPVDQLVLPEAPEDVIDTSDPAARRNELMDRIRDALGGLGDLATPIQFNAMRLERIGANIVRLGGHPNQETLGKLASELATLTAGTALTEEERTAAANAIGGFVSTVTPLMEAIAKLETLPPDAETAELAGRLSQSLEAAMVELAELNGLRGVDPTATVSLRANLRNAQKALGRCGMRLRETLLAGMSNELAKLLSNGHLHFRVIASKLKPDMGELYRQAIILDRKMDEWKSRLLRELNNWPNVFDAIVRDISVWTAAGTDATMLAIRNDLLARSGMNRFVQRCAERAALAGETSPDEPFSRVNANLLGMALRGEIDAVQYVFLKAANYPEEMFRADLVAMNGARMQNAGSGAYNTVYTLDMQNVRTGKTEKVVLKDVELSGESASHGVGGRFSSTRQVRETGKINYATSKAATLVGCGQQITKCGMVHVGSRFQLAQEFAQGDTFDNVIRRNAKVFEMPDPQDPTRTTTVSFADGCKALERLNPSLLEKLKQELQIAAAKLEWADLLTGQLDRNLSNVMLKINVTGTTPETMRVEVLLKGVDNDSGFTEGHVSITKLMHASDWLDPEGQRVFDAEKKDDLASLVKNEAVRNFRMPAFLPLSVKRRLEVLDEETFRREMGPVLGRRALDSAVSRLRDLKELALRLEQQGRLVNDLDPGMLSSADALEEIVKSNNDHWTEGLPPKVKAQASNLYCRLFG